MYCIAFSKQEIGFNIHILSLNLFITFYSNNQIKWFENKKNNKIYVK